MAMIQTDEDGTALEQLPEGAPLGPVMIPFALAADLAGQIENLMSTIETLHGASVPRGLSVKNGRRPTWGISVSIPVRPPEKRLFGVSFLHGATAVSEVS